VPSTTYGARFGAKRLFTSENGFRQTQNECSHDAKGAVLSLVDSFWCTGIQSGKIVSIQVSHTKSVIIVIISVKFYATTSIVGI